MPNNERKWFILRQIENMAGGIQPVTTIEVVVWLHGQGLPRLIRKYFPDLQDVRDLNDGRVKIIARGSKPLPSMKNIITKQEKKMSKDNSENNTDKCDSENPIAPPVSGTEEWAKININIQAGCNRGCKYCSGEHSGLERIATPL